MAADLLICFTVEVVVKVRKQPILPINMQHVSPNPQSYKCNKETLALN